MKIPERHSYCSKLDYIVAIESYVDSIENKLEAQDIIDKPESKEPEGGWANVTWTNDVDTSFGEEQWTKWKAY